MHSWLAPGRNRIQRCEFIHGGETHGESGARLADIISAKNFATVLLNDAVTNTQTQAGPLADLLGGKKGIENPVWLADTVTIVTKQDLHKSLSPRAGYFYAGASRRLPYCVVGVIENVEEHLL